MPSPKTAARILAAIAEDPPFDLKHVGPNSSVVSMDVKQGWEQWFLLRSDVHWDSAKCDRILEQKHLRQAKERNAGIIDNGDLFCAMQGKYDKRSSKESIRPEHQTNNYLDSLVDTAIEYYAPYARNFLILGRGNHETAIQKNHETDLTDRLAAGLRRHGSQCIAGGYGGWLRFKFTIHKTRRLSKLMHHYHGSGGGGPVTAGIIDCNRIGVYTPDADFVLTGHHHTSWILNVRRQRISQSGKLHHDDQTFIRVAGYKDAWADGFAGFEVERRHGPKPKDAAWLRFYYESDEVHHEVIRAT
jgi:hypothetical protein